MEGSTRTREPQADVDSIRDNKLDLVERLADDLAHEIKNPLHAMVINLEVLRRKLARLDPQPPEDLIRYTAVLDSELERVSQRVDLLLRMVRPSRVNEEAGVLSDILEEIRDLIDLECRQHGIGFEMDIPEVIPRPALPPSLARQLFLSLLLSCLEAAEAGSSIQLQTTTGPEELLVSVRVSPASPQTDIGSDLYSPVAHALAGQLGGTIDRIPADQEGAAGYILTLPFTP